MMLCSWLVILYPKAGIITFFTIVDLQASIIENSYVLQLLGSTRSFLLLAGDFIVKSQHHENLAIVELLTLIA